MTEITCDVFVCVVGDFLELLCVCLVRLVENSTTVCLLAFFKVFLKINILGSCGLTNDRLREINSENLIRWIIIAVLNNNNKLQVT